MSLTKLQTFLKKISRFLYFTTDKDLRQTANLSDFPELRTEGGPSVEIVASDPVGLAIPLCIDYLLAREICDEASLAQFLQIEESLVKKALERLRDHGILKDE